MGRQNVMKKKTVGGITKSNLPRQDRSLQGRQYPESLLFTPYKGWGIGGAARSHRFPHLPLHPQDDPRSRNQIPLSGHSDGEMV